LICLMELTNGRLLPWFRPALFVAASLFLTPFEAPAQLQTQALTGHVPHGVSTSRVVRELGPDSRLHLAIGLPLRNQAELDSLLAQIADPSSPSYHHFLNPEQFAARFGPTEQDYQSVVAFAQQNGLIITGTHSNRGVLAVTGDTRTIERAFNVKMKVYSHLQRGEFYAPDREPSVTVNAKVLDISGLDNFAPPQPMSLNTRALSTTHPYITGTGPYGYFIGKDFRAAYAPGVTLTGAGQTVGLLEFDGFFPGDVTKNFAQAGLPVVPTQTVLVDGSNGAAGSANIEVILDIMMAAYMAPGLSKIMVYEGYSPNDVLNRMATDNLAQQLSSSWGFGSQNATTEQIFKQFIAQGQSFLQASGDSGAYHGAIMAPSDSPSLTVVGGTSLSTSGFGGPWLAESAWSGSGGGISTVYPIPTYQVGTTMPSGGGSKNMRNIPDVALTADIQMYLIFNNGQATGIGGTSAAAPLWAGFIALANQQAAANAKPRVGFLNPLLYAIGNSGKVATDFNDIRSGSNGFAAVAGYDLATGWGSPSGQHLIYDLTGTSGAPSFTLSSSVPVLSIKQTASGTASISVADQNGFNSGVTLAAAGLPADVTAVFSPSTTSTASTLTLTAGITAARGTYPLAITGTYGSLSSTAPLALTVLSPSFTLTSSASTLSVLQTGTASTATILSVMPTDGFNSAVTLSTSALPTGVTTLFTPATTTSISSVSFKASTTTPPGTYAISIKGVSGTLSSTVPIALTVLAPAFTLTSSINSLSVLENGTASTATSVTVVATNGFNSAVTLSTSALPTGVTTLFTPATTTSISSVSFKASTTTPPGTYAISIKGVSGTLSSTVPIALIVLAPAFTLSNSVAGLAVARSASVATSVGVSGQNGFNSFVTLSATGLPSGVAATFSPATTSTSSTLTFTAGAAALGGVYPITVTGVSGALKATEGFNLTVTVPSFILSFPAAIALPRGLTALGTATITGQGGFSGTVNLSTSGLPSGVTATATSVATSGTSQVTFTATAAATAGTFPITVSAVSGSLTTAASSTLTVIASPTGTTLANLAPFYNVNALALDGKAFTGGGFDGGVNGSATAYSANLIGPQQTIAGAQFFFGPAGTLDAVSSKTVALPAGQFASIKLLGAAVNGSQTGQVFKITYTDGSTVSITQNVSDWFSPQNFTGEAKALVMPYRNNSQGQRDNRTFYLYEYSLPVVAGKTVANITLPNNRNVVFLSISLR
jgi:subtilase family serine protease